MVQAIHFNTYTLTSFFRLFSEQNYGPRLFIPKIPLKVRIGKFLVTGFTRMYFPLYE